MKIQLQHKQSGAGIGTAARTARHEAGDTSAKTLVAAAFVGMVVALLFAAFSIGFRVMQAKHENLCAARIVMQRAEALRLFTWNQVCDPNSRRQPLFVEARGLLGSSNNRGGVQYAAYLSAPLPAAGSLANPPRSHLRPVTVTVCWTNSHGAKPIVHRRDLQVRLAPNGTPKYVWETL